MDCIFGTCGTCAARVPAGAHPKDCALSDGSSGACYSDAAICSTATKCSDGLHACTSAGYTYKCATNSCSSDTTSSGGSSGGGGRSGAGGGNGDPCANVHCNSDTECTEFGCVTCFYQCESGSCAQTTCTDPF
jgi:hypothetical protein